MIKTTLYKTGFLVLLFVTVNILYGQPRELTLDEAINMAIQDNIEYKSYKLNVEQNKALKKSAFTIENTHFFYGSDKNNIAENGYPLNIIGVEQSFSFPTVYTAQYKVNGTAVSLSEMDLKNQRLLLIKDVSKEYYEIGYLVNKENYYKNLDSLYKTELQLIWICLMSWLSINKSSLL